MTHQRYNYEGFTLIEVLATLVLVGIVVPVAMRGITICLQSTATARYTLEASELADQKIAEMLILRDTATFNSSGNFGNAWPAYAWESQAAIFDSGVYELTVHVTWQQNNQPRALEVSTLVYPGVAAMPEEEDDDATDEGGAP